VALHNVEEFVNKKNKCFSHWAIQAQKGFVPLNDNVHIRMEVIIHSTFNPVTRIRFCFVVITIKYY